MGRADDVSASGAHAAARARARQRRRRLRDLLPGLAAVVVLVAVVVVGTLTHWGGPPRDPGPVPRPSPAVVEASGRTRPLVYAVGSTVHAGDRTIAANARVMFVDATDDGVVFITERDGRVWFDDGSATEPIGRLAGHHLGSYDVHASNPGSLLVWPDGTGHPGPDEADEATEFVVYDTARRLKVAGVPRAGRYGLVLHVDAGHVFANPDSATPGCWLYDVQNCADPHLFRYDVVAGTTRKITRAEYDAELAAQPRLLVGTERSNDLSTMLTARGAVFRQEGRRLVPTGPNGGGDTVLAMPGGEPIRLRLPAGYAAARDAIALAQWLDDDRVVLTVDQDPDEIGSGDSYRAGLVDLLVCRVPDGVCRIAVRVSTLPYLAPGP